MNVVAYIALTLDGVMQSPGRPDEDRRGGFEHGGWMVPYQDAVQADTASQSMAGTGALLFGRRTYEDFFSVWPGRTDNNPFTDVLNRTQKYVTSRTLAEPLPWVNSTLLKGDAAETVARLKERPGKSLVILGSGELVRSLMRCNLIDEYVLSIHPLILGSGRRLFDDAGWFARLDLVAATPTPTGVVIATYRPARSAADLPISPESAPSGRPRPQGARRTPH
jgi:dihydrofolate reductase